MWLDGTALYVVFKLPISYFHVFWGPQHMPLLSVFNYGTLFLEPLVPLMFVLPRGHYSKYILLAAFVGLHVMSVATLDIPYANAACAATAILMFREEIMNFLRRGMAVDSIAAPPAKLGLSGAIALVMVVTLTFAMISSVSLMNWRTAPREQTSRTDNASAVKTDSIASGYTEGLKSVQMTFFGALWLMGIAQQYQLFNWIDDRNYATHYRVVENGREVDPDTMFVRSLRGVLLDFYIHDITWMRIPPEHRAELRTSILTRTAGRYCRNSNPQGEVEAYSSIERIDPQGGQGVFDSVLLMKFTCRDNEVPVFSVAP